MDKAQSAPRPFVLTECSVYISDTDQMIIIIFSYTPLGMIFTSLPLNLHVSQISFYRCNIDHLMLILYTVGTFTVTLAAPGLDSHISVVCLCNSEVKISICKNNNTWVMVQKLSQINRFSLPSGKIRTILHNILHLLHALIIKKSINLFHLDLKVHLYIGDVFLYILQISVQFEEMETKRLFQIWKLNLCNLAPIVYRFKTHLVYFFTVFSLLWPFFFWNKQ